MQLQRLEEALGATAYPGRGIVIGKSGDGRQMMVLYFIMGRSENSRNRVFVADGDGIRTQAFDESKMRDPSLIIYAPVRVHARGTIVTNGDQTDTIYDALSAGGSFEEALRTRTFEPDAPNYTPRISGMVYSGEDRYSLSILKSGDGDPAVTRRQFFDFCGTPAGTGHFIHTYQGDGSPLPSFEGEPVPVALCGSLETLADAAWNSLDPDNKVSLFAREIDITTGRFQTKIYNKNT